jgi:hypothetical protein
LTEANRRADRARRHNHTIAPTRVKAPRPERGCKRCGRMLPNCDRVHCDACLSYFQRDRYDAFISAGRAAYVL